MPDIEAKLEASLIEAHEKNRKLEARLHAQRKELGVLQAFYNRHKAGETQPEPGSVKTEELTEALDNLIYRQRKERGEEVLLSPQWWKHQHIIDGLKTAMSQLSAVAKGFGAHTGKKAERRRRYLEKQNNPTSSETLSDSL